MAYTGIVASIERLRTGEVQPKLCLGIAAQLLHLVKGQSKKRWPVSVMTCIAIATASPAWADLPLTVEELLTAENHWRAELSGNYANSERQGVSLGQHVLIQTGDTQYVSIPSSIGTNRINTDTIVLTPSLRFGLSSDTELYGHASWLSEHMRSEDAAGVAASGDDRFVDAWIGINHRLVPEAASPGVIAFAELALAEWGNERIAHGKSVSVGATVYRVSDPLVLSVTAAWRVNRERQDGVVRRDPGDSLTLSPEVTFSANNDITLSGGLLWRRLESDAVDGIRLGLVNTRTSLSFGLAWAVSERSSLHFSARANVSGGEGVDMGITWVVKPGELPKRQRWK